MSTGNTHPSYLAYLENKRRTVFTFLDKNPLLTPSQLAKLIGIPDEKRKKEMAYLKTLKHDFKGNYQKERGSNRSTPDEFHNVFYKGVLPLEVVKDVSGKLNALRLGFGTGCWGVSKNSNHGFIYKSGLGRIRFFATGTVELFVRKPASDGKCMQLFCDAFTKTNLIDSIAVVEKFQQGLMRRFHATFNLGQKLPYCKVTAFEGSNGFTMVSGDRSHPSSLEFMFSYNSEVQNVRALVEQFSGFMREFMGEPSKINRPKGLYE